MSSSLAVLYGGPSPEHDISILSGLQALRIMSGLAGGEVYSIYWSKAGEFYAVSPDLEADAFISGVPPKSRQLELVVGPGGGFLMKKGFGKPKQLRIEALVNCCHGGPGEDGRLQAALDLAGVPYSGPTASQAALGMDKMAFGLVAGSFGLPVLPRALIQTGDPVPEFPPPWIIKPRFGGSSIGIEIIDNQETLTQLLSSSPHLRAGAVAEPFLPKSEDLNISVRGAGQVVVSEIERPLRSGFAGEFYTYKEKYLTSGEGIVGAPRELPATIGEELRERIRSIALQLRTALPIRGIARIDFLLDDDALWLNEINTVPGALSFYLWRASGVPYTEIISDLIEEARTCPTYQPLAIGADGSALHSAGSIARKLA